MFLPVARLIAGQIVQQDAPDDRTQALHFIRDASVEHQIVQLGPVNAGLCKAIHEFYGLRAGRRGELLD